ncbi:MAG: hypothetical protein AB1847_09135 [bacterium]
MKSSYDLAYLEKEWSQRNLDLFPYIEGLFSLMRSREGNLEKTRKRLQASSAATIVQFLGSDDKDVSHIASKLVQGHQDQMLITAILLYSLTKVTKAGYAAKVGDCLAGCPQPEAGLRYFFPFRRQFPEVRTRSDEFFQHFWRTGTESILRDDQAQKFFRHIFEAILEDLADSIPDLKDISSLPDFLVLKEDLTPALRVYYLVENRPEIKMIFDQGLKTFGRHLGSIRKLISFESHTYLDEVLPVVLAFIGLLRLEQDRQELDRILSKIAEFDCTKPLATRLEILIEKVISLLEDPNKYVYETLPHDLFF